MHRRLAVRVTCVAGSLALPLARPQPARAQAPLPALTAAGVATLDSAARAFIARTRTPGLALAVVIGDSSVYATGFGVATLDTTGRGGGARVTPETLFQLGSLTKPFTAALAATLADDGRLALDAPVGRYVTGLAPALARVTTAQLLSHSAGIRHETAEYGSHDEGAFGAYARSWTARYAMLPPGLAFSYSNPGFTLAGLVAQEAGGRSYAELMQTRVFDPLGMRSATFRPTVAMTYPLAVGHRGAPSGAPNGAPAEMPSVVRPLADDTRHWPAGYMYASARDVARFAAAFLSGGRLDGRQALAPGVVRAMQTPRVEVPTELEPAHYGLGLFLETYRGIPTVWHAGDMPGYTAMLRMLPAQRVAVVALLNRQGVRPDPLLDATLVALGMMPDSTPARPQPLLPTSAAELAARTGRYTNAFTVEVRARDGRLFVDRPGGEAALYRIGPDRFTTDSTRRFRPAELEIVPARNGKPAYLSMWVWSFAKER